MSKSERQRLGKAGRTDAEVTASIEKISEKDLQRHIAALLSQRDIWCNWSKMHKRATNRPGTPDFLFVLQDKWGVVRAIAIEAKVGNAAPSLDQIRCHEHMRRNGWLVYVVRSLEEVRKILE